MIKTNFWKFFMSMNIWHFKLIYNEEKIWKMEEESCRLLKQKDLKS